MYNTEEGRNIAVRKRPIYDNDIPIISPFKWNSYVYILRYPFTVISINTSNPSCRKILKNKFLTINLKNLSPPNLFLVTSK
jgi:hypothetical protein